MKRKKAFLIRPDAFANIMYGKSDKSDRVDVIVVLGAAVWEHGVSSPSLCRRILHAVALLHSGLSNTLLVTGGVGKHPPSEAQAMRRLALEHGVFKEQVIMEETAKSTLDSAIACSDIIKRNGWSTALIVSDRYHLFRSILFSARLVFMLLEVCLKTVKLKWDD